MTATGFAFAAVSDFWPLLVIAVVGTLNPSSGDVSVFLPLEQAVLANVATDRGRTALFARYSVTGALAAALGALFAALPDLVVSGGYAAGKTPPPGVVVPYGRLRLPSGLIYPHPPAPLSPPAHAPSAP